VIIVDNDNEEIRLSHINTERLSYIPGYLAFLKPAKSRCPVPHW